uniref:dynein regulatory complex subunit 4-like isoform X1 n=1 Tax=Semicossyphus pulcher TaxID=241346 RepID=UPI0037E8CCAB
MLTFEQPPKNKGSSKKPPKAKTPTLIDGLTKEEMTKEQLEEYIVRLREELDREREERNYFQLERDKIHTFQEITERQLEDSKAELKNLQRDVEEDERRHQVEIKVYKQKMKHLLCEHQNTISELKADALVSTEAVQIEQQQLESELHEEMKTVMVDILELDNESLVKELELKHGKEMNETRNSLEKQVKDVEAKYEKKMQLLQQELENLRRKEVGEREDQWNRHVSALIEDHNRAVSEIDALMQELDLDNTLLAQVKDIKETMKAKEKDLVRVLEENRNVAEDLSEVKEEMAATERKMKHFTVTKNDSEKIRQKELNDLKKDHKELEQKFSKLQLERDELYKAFTQNVQEVQQKAGMRGELLGRQLSALTDRLEKTQAQLDSVLSASNMDQTALQGVMNQTEESLDSINNSIKDLQQKKALISTAQKNLQLYYQKKQRALFVSEQELV